MRSLASDELPLAYNAQFAPAMVADVLAMLKLMPTVDALLFDPHPSRGIGYWHGEDTLVWYGRGGDFAQKTFHRAGNCRGGGTGWRATR